MKIIVDIGNSFSKIALFDDGDMIKRTETSVLDQQFIAEFVGKAEIEQIGFSSVRSSYVADLKLLQSFGPVTELREVTQLPIDVDYQAVETLGTDRLASAVYAASLYRDANVLTITIGSCMTCDLVTKDGCYRGGSISPGPEMRMKAMHHFTGKLPDLPFNFNFELPGKSTIECMQAGACLGIVAEIEYYINYYKQHYRNLNVLLSGGYAPFFEKKIKCTIFAQNDVVLKGLSQILNFYLEHNYK